MHSPPHRIRQPSAWSSRCELPLSHRTHHQRGPVTLSSVTCRTVPHRAPQPLSPHRKPCCVLHSSSSPSTPDSGRAQLSRPCRHSVICAGVLILAVHRRPSVRQPALRTAAAYGQPADAARGANYRHAPSPLQPSGPSSVHSIRRRSLLRQRRQPSLLLPCVPTEHGAQMRAPLCWLFCLGSRQCQIGRETWAVRRP